MFFFLLACAIYKTSLVGVVDVIGEKNCTIEIKSGELITVESSMCNSSKEGDIIIFYARKK